MKVAEERTFRALSICQTVQVGKKGIREVTGFGGTRPAAKDRSRSRAQVSSVLGEKMLPGIFTSFGASGGQGQILEMQRADILFELLRRDRSGRQGLKSSNNISARCI